MSPDWSGVQRLLIGVGDGAIAPQLLPALQWLHQALPHTTLTLLLPEFPISCGFLQLPDIEWITVPTASLLSCPTACLQWITELKNRQFDAAIIFTKPLQSPYLLSYLCYLAHIPIRLAQSQEFGGGVLSTWIQPPMDPVPLTEYLLHLVQSAGISTHSIVEFSDTKNSTAVFS